MADVIGERPGTGGSGKASVRFHDETDGSYSMAEASHLRYWNTSTLLWERATGTDGAVSTSSTGSGAVTVADGADVAQGATTDASSANTLVGLLKAIKAAITGTLSTSVSNFPATQAVSGPLTDTQLRATSVPVSLSSSALAVAATASISSAGGTSAFVFAGKPKFIAFQVDTTAAVGAAATVASVALNLALPAGGNSQATLTEAFSWTAPPVRVTAPLNINTIYYVPAQGATGVSIQVAAFTSGTITVKVWSFDDLVSTRALPMTGQNYAGNGVIVPAAVTATNEQVAAIGYSGTLTGDATNGTWVNVKNASLPITAASLPLPTDASTETTLAALKTQLNTGIRILRKDGADWLDTTEGSTFADSRNAIMVLGRSNTGSGATATAKPFLMDASGNLMVSLTSVPSHAVTMVDGGSVAVGAVADAAYVSGSGTLVALLKGIFTKLSGSLAVTMATNTPDVTDRAARLLGVVYGSQGQQVKQTPTNFNLQTESAVGGTLIDPRSIRALTSADVVTAAQGTAAAAAAAWPTKVTDGTNTGAVKAASAIAAATDPAQVVQQSPQRADASTLALTTISGANASVTLTITAAAAGLFHYITSIEIVNINPTTTAIAAAASLLSYTTTNLPGNPAWNCGTLLAAGAEKVVTRLAPATPLKSSVAATNTTIVAPAIGTGGQVRITVTYYTAP